MTRAVAPSTIGRELTSGISAAFIQGINAACAEPNPVRSNQQITQLHYEISEALAGALGRDCGPNFHTWAVWGSRKAGVTIRQEDLDSAIRNAIVTAGIVGTLIGAFTGVLAGRVFHWNPDTFTATTGAIIGALTGAWAGKQIAISSRRKAAALILEGNQTVLKDIGEQSAHFVELLENGASIRDRKAFVAGLCPGSTELRGQDRLASAFHSYLSAFDTTDVKIRQEAMIAGNCMIVYHEHIRLEPYILGAMPWIVQRCVTQRLMTYEIGDRILAVSKDVPGGHASTAVKNWTKIDDRMRYVFALFREFHNNPQVFSKPSPKL
jgi:hypothetical protein